MVSNIKDPQDIDVLVVGGGHAGLCAAITAREAGATVLLVEAAPAHMRGGNSRHTRNLRAMHDVPVGTLDGQYTEDEYWADLYAVTGGHTDEDLARRVIRESENLMHWLEARQVRFQAALSGTLSLNRTNAFFLGGGKALVNALYRTAEALGVAVLYEAEVVDLQIRQGTFDAADIRCRDDIKKVSAGAVIVASGGFQANEDWMREAWGERAQNFIIRGTPYATGLPLRALMRAGAETVSDPTQCHAIALDARGPRYDGGIVTRLDCVCFSIVVNQRGERFYDEGEDFWPKRYAIWGRLIADQPEQIAYAIVDSKVTHQFMPALFPSIEAENLTDLAQKLDIDPNHLEQTVSTFNNAVVAGHYDPTSLDDCHTDGINPPKSHWALPIDTGPFAAYPLRPGITFTYLGAKVDAEARVLFKDLGPSPNIFAAGEVMAGNVLGQGYCAGTGMTIGGVFGRIAGNTAVGAA